MNAQANVFEPKVAQLQRIQMYRTRLEDAGELKTPDPTPCRPYLLERDQIDMTAIYRAWAYSQMMLDMMARNAHIAQQHARFANYVRSTPHRIVAFVPEKTVSFVTAMKNDNIRAFAAVVACDRTALDALHFQPHLVLGLVGNNIRCTGFLMNYLETVSDGRRDSLFRCSFARNESFMIMREAGVRLSWLDVSHITDEQKTYMESIGWVADVEQKSDSDDDDESKARHIVDSLLSQTSEVDSKASDSDDPLSQISNVESKASDSEAESESAADDEIESEDTPQLERCEGVDSANPDYAIRTKPVDARDVTRAMCAVM